MRLSELEHHIGVSLPEEYRSLLQNYPEELRGTTVEGYELVSTVETLLSENLSVRQGPVFGLDWPRNHFVVGSDGSGNLYTLNLNETPVGVYEFDHEDQSFRRLAESLPDWLPELRRRAKEN